MFSSLKHNWQIAFLWQEQIDNKEPTGSVFKVTSNSESSTWKELSALPSIPTYPSVIPSTKFVSILAHLAKAMQNYLVLIFLLLSDHLCAIKTRKRCFNHLIPERKWANILAILLIQFNICLHGSLPQAYACILNINRDSLMQFKPLPGATCRLLWSF